MNLVYLMTCDQSIMPSEFTILLTTPAPQFKEFTFIVSNVPWVLRFRDTEEKVHKMAIRWLKISI